jgi:hypothetical protein
MAVLKPAVSNAAWRGPAVERSSIVIRIRAAMGGKIRLETVSGER